jgi:conjugal transfer ATP-binding protein TraC
MILAGRRGQLLTWSPFDNRDGNYNVCVVGKSGSGKSVFMQELMVSTLGLGGHVFVLDVGRSFEKTCALLGGQFIEFKAKTPLCLNPFSSLPDQNLEDTDDALSMLKPVLLMMASPHQSLDGIAPSLMEQAMRETWKRYGQASTITHMAQWLMQHSDKVAQDLGTMLYPYTEEGAYGRFFHGPSTVRLDSSLVVIELEELKERKDLQAVVIQMMMVTITNQMFLGDRRTPFHVVLDEAWDMLRGSQTGVFIETLARRLRKYFGSLVVGTQSINDFFANPGAQAAFENSDWMCLLAQKQESIDQLKNTSRLSLTFLMESQLKSLSTKQGQYAEVMIARSQGYAVARLLLDPYSNLLYSTKAEDYSALNDLKSQGFSVAEGLDRLLADRKGRNLG